MVENHPTARNRGASRSWEAQMQYLEWRKWSPNLVGALVLQSASSLSSARRSSSSFHTARGLCRLEVLEF